MVFNINARGVQPSRLFSYFSRLLVQGCRWGWTMEKRSEGTAKEMGFLIETSCQFACNALACLVATLTGSSRVQWTVANIKSISSAKRAEEERTHFPAAFDPFSWGPWMDKWLVDERKINDWFVDENRFTRSWPSISLLGSIRLPLSLLTYYRLINSPLG